MSLREQVLGWLKLPGLILGIVFFTFSTFLLLTMTEGANTWIVLGTAIGWMLLLVAIYALEVLYQNPNAAAPVLVSPKASAGFGMGSCLGVALFAIFALKVKEQNKSR